MRCRRLLIILSLLLGAACSSEGGGSASAEELESGGDASTSAPASSSPTTTTTTTTTTTEPPRVELELIGVGPYEVGVATVIVDDGERDRPLTVDVWFPIADGATGDPHDYTFFPGVFYRSPLAVTAEPESAATDQRFPLVVYSHGSSGLRYIHSNFTETIASHGYVVAAPDHTGNTALELIIGSTDDPALIAFNRPNDVSAVIDEIIDGGGDVESAIAAIIDPERVAVTGHSFGGFTSFATVTGFENAHGTYEADQRVDAIIALAPATAPALLTDDRLAAVDVPLLMIVGTDDKTTPIDPNVTRPWELTTSELAYRVELQAAEHQTFTDVCDYVEFLPTLDAVPDVITATIDEFASAGCQPDDMPIDRAQALTNTFAVTFLEEVFRDGDPIDPTTVELPGDVTYLVR